MGRSVEGITKLVPWGMSLKSTLRYIFLDQRMRGSKFEFNRSKFDFFLHNKGNNIFFLTLF